MGPRISNPEWRALGAVVVVCCMVLPGCLSITPDAATGSASSTPSPIGFSTSSPLPELTLASVEAWGISLADSDGNYVDDRLEGMSVQSTDLVSVNVLLNTPAQEVDLEKYHEAGLTNIFLSQYVAAISGDIRRSDLPNLAKLDNFERVDLQESMSSTNEMGNKASGIRSVGQNLGVWQDFGLTGKGIVIAILDTGVDEGHECLAGKLLGGYDARRGMNTNPNDVHGHGTHVACTALGNGGISQHPFGREAGAAPEAGLLDVKVLDDDGEGTDAWVSRGIEWAIDNRDTDWGIPGYRGVQIISMSLGNQQASNGRDALSAEVNAAAAHGIVVVASGGNKGPARLISSPAAADSSIAVANVDDQGTPSILDDKLASTSSRGPRIGGTPGESTLKPTLAAPGSNVVSAQVGTARGYIPKSGTSMAAPLVAGTVALMLQADPNLSWAQVRQILGTSAHHVGPGWDPGFGYGELNAYAAVQAAIALTKPTLPTYSPTTSPSTPNPGTSTTSAAPTSSSTSSAPGSGGIRVQGPSIWPMPRLDAACTGNYASTKMGAPQTLWTAQVPGAPQQPIVVDGKLIVPYVGGVAFIDATTGQRLATTQHSGIVPGYTDVVASRGYAYVSTPVQSPYTTTVFDIQTGQVVRTLRGVHPVISGNYVATTGERGGNDIHWNPVEEARATSGIPSDASPQGPAGGTATVGQGTAFGNRIYFGGDRIRAVPLPNELTDAGWESPSGGAWKGGPSTDGTQLFFEGNGQALLTNGTRSWAINWGGGHDNVCPATTQGRVFMSFGSNGFLAESTADGSQLWIQPAVTNSRGAIVTGNAVIVRAGTLYALDANTGNILWSNTNLPYATGDPPPILVENSLYLVSANGAIHALRMT